MAETTTEGETGPITEAGAPPVGAAEPVAPAFEEEQQPQELPLVSTAELPVGTALAVPRPGTTPFQDKLAAGNAAARTASLKRLAEWFPGYDFEDAAQNVDARRFTVLSAGDALLNYLNPLEAVDRLLFEHEHYWGLGGISFSHGDVEGHRPPPPYAARLTPRQGLGRLDGGGLARALDDRWTAIINSGDVYDPALNDVSGHLSRAYGTNINTNIYISFGPSKGFGAHWDNHDTIIVPVRGAKRWALFEPAVLSAERPWIGPEVSDKPLWEGVIEPGMVLVIPRGWGHRVDGSDDLSIHYTIGVARLEIINLIERVTFEAGNWPLLRGDVPFDVRETAVSYDGSVFDDPQGFARTIAEVASPEMLERAVASHRARVMRPRFPTFEHVFRGVAHGDWSGLALRLQAPAGVMVVGESDESAVLAFDNFAVRVDPVALDAFAALTHCEPVPVDDLPPVGDGKDRRGEFARSMAVTGLATVEEVR